jgi:hypothetical protein
MFNNGPYLDSLHQYGVQHRAYNDPRIGTGQGVVEDNSDPKSGFQTSDAEAQVTRAIDDDGMPFDSNNIYSSSRSPVSNAPPTLMAPKTRLTTPTIP